MIRLTAVITDKNEIKKEPSEKGSYQIMCMFNRKFAKDSIFIRDLQVQTGWGSTTAPYLFSHICRITGDNIFAV